MSDAISQCKRDSEERKFSDLTDIQVASRIRSGYKELIELVRCLEKRGYNVEGNGAELPNSIRMYKEL